MSSLIPTGGESCPVDLVTFDSLVERFGAPQVVKIDIEGGEALILDQMAARCFEIHASMIVSLHGPYWPPGWAPNLEGFRLTVLEATGGFSVVLGEP